MNDRIAEWKRWCSDPVFDERTRAAAAAMSEEERRDAFYRDDVPGLVGDEMRYP